MAFEITESNLDALQPLFKPWEEPIQYRVKNEQVEGGPAEIRPGRRPSLCPLVRSIRAEVDGWRKGGYAGVSETSRSLLNYWFKTEHLVSDEDGNSIPFRYHWAQREAMESIVYLYEVRHVRSVAELMFEFGDNALADIALGINPEDDRWPKNCCKVATGGGKTKIMSLAIAWSYYNSLYKDGLDLAKHFVLIAPNLTVYERLKDDFENLKIFHKDPVLPEEWRKDFLQQVQVILQDEPGGSAAQGTIYLTNIHRLYETRNQDEGEEDVESIFGPNVKRAQALDTGAELRDRITSNSRLMVLNDEAHHLHDPDLAWNRAIDSLHAQSISKGNAGICQQLDFSATPKHNNGELFRHIICDFPLGEAVDAGIVKVPVLGESDDIVVRGDRNTPAPQKYRTHLMLGYQRYEATYEEWNKVRKPILFVMTEDTGAANDIADYLDSDSFPLLKNRVLNLHTRIKGRIKKVMRGGREIKEFVETETGMKPDDLRELREMSRELDSKNSKFRCVVSVMMLREGWDIRNVMTIIPLRPYSTKSGILPEQTLGRGLRRMEPMGEKPELVTVVHHPAFRELYERELAQEGLDLAVLPVREAYKQTVSIYVDHENKPVEDLEIELPLVSEAIETSAILEGLTSEDIKQYFDQNFKPLPVGNRKDGKVDYKERQLFTDEIVTRMQLDVGLLTNAWSAAGYFAQMLGRACKISNPHQVLTPLVEAFLSKVLFERDIDLYSGEVDHRMRDMDVMEHIRATFTPLILAKTVQKKERKRISKGVRLSTWKPYQATSTQKRPAVPADRTMFNLVPCENEFERAFADFCDYAGDVKSFAKNAGPQKLMIDYLRPDGHRAFYVPDFFIRLGNDRYILCELKGKEDALVPIKARAAIEWCKASSKGKISWQYLYVPYHLFQQSSAGTLEELVRACEPSLKNLLKEADTGQQELTLFEATAKKESDELFEKVCREAEITSLEESLKEPIRQAILVLDHAVRTSMPELGHAFQPLLHPLDELSLGILKLQLEQKIPTDARNREDYFNPYLDNLPGNKKAMLDKHGRYLKDNLVFGRSIMRLGTLLFCLRYAREGGWGASGVWRDVQAVFISSELESFYKDLEDVNQFRNTRVAHVETPLTKAEEAWDAMHLWLRCIDKMAKAIE